MAVWTDIDIELTKQTDGDVLKDEDVEAIKNSLMNILTTMPGSRRMLPTFAFGGEHILFEPMDPDTSNKLGSYLLASIKTWEDRIIVNNIHVNANHDWNQYEVRLNFTVKGTNKPQKLDFILQRT